VWGGAVDDPYLHTRNELGAMKTVSLCDFLPVHFAAFLAVIGKAFQEFSSSKIFICQNSIP
jgi:hypothetical protein